MSYALFSNDLKISDVFSTKAEVWHHAAGSGLVTEVSSGEEDPPRRILHTGYAIRAVAPDAPVSDRKIAQVIAARAVNPPSAAAAS